MPETQCSPPRCAGPGGVRRSPWPGGADRHGTSKTSGFMQGVGRPQSVRGPASFGGQAKRSECQMASPGKPQGGWEDATPSPQTTGHQLQGNRQREAGSPDSGGRVVGQIPGTAEGSLAHGLQALHAVLGQRGLRHPLPPQAPSPRLLPLFPIRAPTAASAQGPQALSVSSFSCPKPPGPGQQRAGR